MSATASPGAVRRLVPFVWLALLILAPAWAAWRPSGPRSLLLDLGPGDGPYVSGFGPEWEIEEARSAHWTTYDAQVAWPLEVRGPLRLTLRYSRVLPQTAVVDVAVAGRPAERFTARGGLWEERTLAVGLSAPAPARVDLRIDSHDRRDLGLKLDWIRLDAEGARLRGWARVRPVAAVAVLIALLGALGWSPLRRAALATPAALAITALLLRDAWLTHRLLAGVPELLALALAAVLAVRELLRLREGFPAAMRLAGTVAACAFLVRAAAVNHPSFYYPDLLVHARLVGVVRDARFDFLRAPSHYLFGEPGAGQARGPSGLWLRPFLGQAVGLPYSLAFHAPFAPFEATMDRRIGWIKLWGAALSVVPILALGALAKRWGLSLLSLGAMVLVPTYLSRLSLALLPALFGHAVEMLFLVWLARLPEGRLSARTTATGALLLACCQLAYVSPASSLLVAVLALGLLFSREPDARTRAGGFLAMLVAASAISLLVYYRDFVGPLLAAGTGLASYQGDGARSIENPLVRMRAVLGATFVLAGMAGGFALRRVASARALLGAWAIVGALLLALRTAVPVMRFLHEELWLAPLVCLGAGQAVAWLWAKGRTRPLAVALALVLACEGAWLQWRLWTAQLR